jgi:hypothetical protein
MNYRCIVTGNTPQGRSFCAENSLIKEAPGWMFNFWSSLSTPADNNDKVVFPVNDTRLGPVEGGTIFRFFHILPDSAYASYTAQDLERIAEQIGLPKAAPPSGEKLWHRTDTLDYVVVLQGEPILHLEEDDVSLKPFDTIIQRGTNHAWSNPGEAVAIAACVLIDALPANSPLRQD